MKNQFLWEQLRAPELKKLADEGAVVMMPMGAIEQHGPIFPCQPIPSLPSGL